MAQKLLVARPLSFCYHPGREVGVIVSSFVKASKPILCLRNGVRMKGRQREVEKNLQDALHPLCSVRNPPQSPTRCLQLRLWEATHPATWCPCQRLEGWVVWAWSCAAELCAYKLVCIQRKNYVVGTQRFKIQYVQSSLQIVKDNMQHKSGQRISTNPVESLWMISSKLWKDNSALLICKDVQILKYHFIPLPEWQKVKRLMILLSVGKCVVVTHLYIVDRVWIVTVFLEGQFDKIRT